MDSGRSLRGSGNEMGSIWNVSLRHRSARRAWIGREWHLTEGLTTVDLRRARLSDQATHRLGVVGLLATGDLELPARPSESIAGPPPVTANALRQGYGPTQGVSRLRRKERLGQPEGSYR
jgi:hypothetical protein